MSHGSKKLPVANSSSLTACGLGCSVPCWIRFLNLSLRIVFGTNQLIPPSIARLFPRTKPQPQGGNHWHQDATRKHRDDGRPCVVNKDETHNQSGGPGEALLLHGF